MALCMWVEHHGGEDAGPGKMLYGREEPKIKRGRNSE